MIKNPSVFLTLESRSFSWIFALLLLFGFPLALIAPQGLGMESQWLIKFLGDEKLAFNAFRFKIPAIAIASYLSLALLIIRTSFSSLPSIEKKTWIFAAIFLLFTLISGYTHHSGPFETLSLCAFIFVPLAVAQLGKPKALLAYFCGIYYFLNLAYYFLLDSPTGIAANKNWLIAGLLATSPWAVICLRKALFKYLIFLPRSSRNASSTLLSFLLVWSCTLVSLKQLNSRAAYLAFAIICFYQIFRGASQKTKAALLLSLLISIIGGAYYAKQNYASLTHNELRPLLWQGTAKMIEAAPLLGNAGPGQFSNTFPNYRLSEQLMLPIAAPNSSHPHNELLRIASEVGLPACLALLCFYLLILKSPGRKTYPALHAVIVIGTCSFFDKLLIENATTLLFLFNMGLLIKPKTPNHSLKQSASFRRVFALIIIAFGSFIAFNKSLASWHYRQGFNDQNAALLSFELAKKKNHWQSSFANYAKAANKAPYNTRYNYHAANAALMGLQDASKAAPYLSVLLERAPNYINTNRLLCYFQELRFMQKSSPNEKSQAIQLAIQANAKELQINGTRLSNINDGLLFALRHQFIPLALKTQQAYKEQSLRLGQYLFQDELNQKIQSWHQAILKNEMQEALAIANSLHAIKGLRYIDPLYLRVSSKEFKDSKFLDPKQFTPADFYFWKEIITLRQEISRQESFVDFCQKQLKSIQVDAKSPFSSANEVLSTQRANPIAFSSFFAQSASILGRPHLILESANHQAYILIQNGRHSLLIDIQKQTLENLPHEQIISLIRKQNLKTSFFSSPQSFFSANTYLFSLYNSQFKEQSISLNTPSLNWMVSKQALGKNSALKIRTESFFHLAQQLKDF